MKLALLDTDFISKTHTVRIDDDNHLIDRVLEMPGYTFVCHEQIVAELGRHNSHAPAWMEQKINSRVIDKYTDERILAEMAELFGQIAPYEYTNMLRVACNAFYADYFTDHYADLKNLNYRSITVNAYLGKLKELDTLVGEGNHLGEIKAYILLQWLGNQFGEQLFYFCSDDGDARNGILNIDGIKIRCITLVSVYQRLHLESKYTEQMAKPYIDAILGYFAAHDQANIRVVEASAVGRHQRVPCEQVLREIYEDKFVELANGLLKYRQ